MVEVKKYHLPPTALIPNSPYPLLHYPGLFLSKQTSTSTPTVHSVPQIHDFFATNGWQTQWIYRYGPTQPSHYHSQTHECMAVLSGTATIRFGVADITTTTTTTTTTTIINNNNNDQPIEQQKQEEKGIYIPAHAGDVFIIPAGVAHKTHDTFPRADFALLTPGDGHTPLSDSDAKASLPNVDITSGFCMIGAYPDSQYSDWDFATGGEYENQYQKVWDVPKPERDPVLGESQEGICGLWNKEEVNR